MNLMIVESPNKIKKLKSYLGSNWEVKASIGHFRDLPSKTMGYEIEGNNLKVNYQMTSKKNISKNIKDIKVLAKKYDKVYLATDPDREGEAIAWHIQQYIGKANYTRITFTEITKNAVLESIKNERSVNLNLVNAQQARRVIDRIIGYKASNLVDSKLEEKCTAGRVQSVALRMVVELERKIRNFTSKNAWNIKVKFKNSDSDKEFLLANLHKIGKKVFGYELSDSTYFFDSKNKVIEYVKSLDPNNYQITKITPSKHNKKAFAPFVTSSMQRAAGVQLKFDLEHTDFCAQKLFEAGLITYIRTDAPYISDDALDMVRNHISKEHGEKYLSPKPNVFPSKADSQEAHECIRPTSLDHKLEDIADEDQRKLYDLIRKQFISCQMSDAIYYNVSCEISNGEAIFISKSKILKFDGWSKLTNKSLDANTEDDVEEEDLQLLPSWAQIGLNPKLIDAEPNAKNTKPPGRYSESGLVKALEKNGIGRPSTYKSILKSLKTHKYIKVSSRKVFAEQFGEKLLDMLMALYPNSWVEIPYTSTMEEKLDLITEGKLNWKSLVIETHHFMENENKKNGSKFKDVKPPRDINSYKNNIDKHKIDIPCLKCNSPLKMNKGGVFCSNEDNCDFLIYRKVHNIKITDQNLLSLLTERKTEVVKGFLYKNGKGTFNCPLILDKNFKVGFEIK